MTRGGGVRYRAPGRRSVSIDPANRILSHIRENVKYFLFQLCDSVPRREGGRPRPAGCSAARGRGRTTDTRRGTSHQRGGDGQARDGGQHRRPGHPPRPETPEKAPRGRGGGNGRGATAREHQTGTAEPPPGGRAPLKQDGGQAGDPRPRPGEGTSPRAVKSPPRGST